MNDSFTAQMTKIDQFAKTRKYERFHTPKNLSMALAVEAAELMEHYQWLEPGQDADVFAAQDEIADVMIYALRMCSVLGVDPAFAIGLKLGKNEMKHPAGYGGEIEQWEKPTER